MNSDRSTVILVMNEGMGKSDRDLQLKLFDKYLQLLNDHNILPNAFCFYTEGVRLVTEGSPVLEKLETLEKKGVRLIICSTCLDSLGLTGQVRVGIIGGMPDIIEAQFKADKVITI